MFYFKSNVRLLIDESNKLDISLGRKFQICFWINYRHWKKKIHAFLREKLKTFSRVIEIKDDDSWFVAKHEKHFEREFVKMAATSWNSHRRERREKLYVTYSIKCWLHEHEFFFKLSLWYRCELSQVYIM